MRLLICLAFTLSSCSSNRGGGPSTSSQKPATANQTANEVKLSWSQFSALPADFAPPVEHMSSDDGKKILLIDKNGKSFLIDAEEKTVSAPALWVNMKRDADTLGIFQTSEYSAWQLRNDKLQWIRWESNAVDHQIVQTPLSELLPNVAAADIRIFSPRVDQLLLVSGERRVHVQRNESKLSVSRISGLKSSNIFSTSTAHIFEYGTDKLSRLLTGSRPSWAAQKLTHTGLPASAKDFKMDVFGTPERLQMRALAISDNSFWLSLIADVGSEASLNVPQPESGNDGQFKNLVEPFLVKHCGACHEGRAPVFIRTESGKKTALSEVVAAEKEKIKFRITLPRTDGRIMPPYAPYPAAEELTAIVKWLEK